jgi:lipopolysaccharide export system permease protein
MKKLDKLILVEFIPLFIVGVLAFTAIMSSFTLLKEAMKYFTKYELEFLTLVKFFWLGLPQILAYTFPMGALLGSLLAFGRLSSNNEITAIRAGGVGFGRIVLPLVFAAWALVCLTFLISERIAPQSTSKALMMVKSAVLEKGLSMKTTNISYFDGDSGWMFGAAEGDGKVFTDVILTDFKTEEKITYFAESAEWHPDKWVFHNVTVLGYDSGGDQRTWTLNSEQSSINFTRTPSEIMYEGKDPEQMSLQELKQNIRLEKENNKSETRILKLRSTYYAKIAAPFSCLIFILISAPLGMNPQRGTSTVGMGLSMILVFVYYLILTVSIKAGESGAIEPLVAAWIPNVVFLIAGLWLIARYYWSYGR